MKKCKCKCFKVISKIIGIVLLANIALFAVFFFDLDGKFFFNIYEPFMKKHYENMQRKDVLKDSPYDVNKYPKYEY